MIDLHLFVESIMHLHLTRFRSPRLPATLAVYTVRGWPPRAFAAAGMDVLLVAEGACRGVSLVRIRRALAVLSA